MNRFASRKQASALLRCTRVSGSEPGAHISGAIKLGMPLAAICILFICLVLGVVVVRVTNELMQASQILENSIVGNF